MICAIMAPSPVVAHGQVEQDVDSVEEGLALAHRVLGVTNRHRELPVTVRYTEYSRSKGQPLINGINILFDLAVHQR